MSIMKEIELRVLIMTYVTQQLWQPPETLINRYNTKSMVVKGSAKIVHSMVNELMQSAKKYQFGLDNNSYLQYYHEMSNFLAIESRDKDLDARLNSLRKEMSIDDPRIFFSTTLGFILESFQSKIITRYTIRIKNMKKLKLTEKDIQQRLNMMSECSDDDLSLMFNLEILKELSRNVGYPIEGVDDSELNQVIIKKICGRNNQ